MPLFEYFVSEIGGRSPLFHILASDSDTRPAGDLSEGDDSFRFLDEPDQFCHR